MPVIRRKRRQGEAAVGAEIRRLRNERNLTLKELADRCGFGFVYLSDLELGRRPLSPHTAHRIGVALGVDPVPLVQDVVQRLIDNIGLEVVVRKKFRGVP